MRKQHPASSKTLASGQISEQELQRLLAIPLEGAKRLFYNAKWRSGDLASGTSGEDLNEIEEIDDLLWLDVDFYYSNGEVLHLGLLAGAAEVRWIGAGAGDKARRLEYEWARLPVRARISFRVAYYVGIFMSLLGAALAAYWHFRGALLVWQWGLLLLAFAFAFPPIFKASTFTSLRASWKPFIVERPEHWWHDYKWLISTVIAFIAAVAAITSALVSISKV